MLPRLEENKEQLSTGQKITPPNNSKHRMMTMMISMHERNKQQKSFNNMERKSN